MSSSRPQVLTFNGGSSSIKFALFDITDALQRVLHGQIDRIGHAGSQLRFEHVRDARHGQHPVSASNHREAALALLDWLASEEGLGSMDALDAVGHRVVHGMARTEPSRVTPELLRELRSIESCDPDHLPGELDLIEVLVQSCPKLPQIVCFDTAFHRDMPRVATLLPIPRRYQAQGLRRYGFHGLSYAYLMEALQRLAGAATARGRVVLAHLGNGASLAAVKDGHSIDTSMGFTPNSGLPMSTRSGDLEPGLAAFLERDKGMGTDEFNDMVNHASGLLGISETSSDVRDLLEREQADPRAAEAIALFCYQGRKTIGAYAAALGGLDTLVFSGGIGENAAVIRARMCDGLGFLGVQIDAAGNAAHADIISTPQSRCTVRVIRTDEEQMIARSVCRTLDLGPRSH
ncbi:MAG: acetate/propionate family kinase [Burkholderiaceae bacterium]